MEARDFLYFVFMVVSVIGIYKYKLNKKSLLFIAFAGIQNYSYWDISKVEGLKSIFINNNAPAKAGTSFIHGFDIYAIFFILFMVAFFLFVIYCYKSDTPPLYNKKAVAKYHEEECKRLAKYREERRQEYYSRKRKNETAGDIAWGVAWRAIAYAITGLWFWKAK